MFFADEWFVVQLYERLVGKKNTPVGAGGLAPPLGGYENRT